MFRISFKYIRSCQKISDVDDLMEPIVDFEENWMPYYYWW